MFVQFLFNFSTNSHTLSENMLFTCPVSNKDYHHIWNNIGILVCMQPYSLSCWFESGCKPRLQQGLINKSIDYCYLFTEYKAANQSVRWHVTFCFLCIRIVAQPWNTSSFILVTVTSGVSGVYHSHKLIEKKVPLFILDMILYWRGLSTHIFRHLKKKR